MIVEGGYSPQPTGLPLSSARTLSLGNTASGPCPRMRERGGGEQGREGREQGGREGERRMGGGREGERRMEGGREGGR